MSKFSRTLKLFNAIDKHDIPRIETLTKQGVNLAYLVTDQSDKNKKKTAVEYAKDKLDWDSIKAILKFTKETDEKDTFRFGATLLSAVWYNKIDTAELLLKAKASKNWTYSDTKNTCLHVAVTNDNPDMLALLLSYSFDTTQKNKAQQTAFELAVSLGYFKCALLIMKHSPLSEIEASLKKDTTLDEALIEKYRLYANSLLLNMSDQTIPPNDIAYAIKLVQYYYCMMLQYHKNILVSESERLKETISQNALINAAFAPDSEFSKIITKIMAINSILKNPNITSTINIEWKMNDQLKKDYENFLTCNETIHPFVVKIQIALQEIKFGVQKIREATNSLTLRLFEGLASINMQQFNTWMNTIPTTFNIQKIIDSYIQLTQLLKTLEPSAGRYSLLDEYISLAKKQISTISEVTVLPPAPVVKAAAIPTAPVVKATPNFTVQPVTPPTQRHQQNLVEIDELDQHMSWPAAASTQTTSTSLTEISMWDRIHGQHVNASKKDEGVVYTPLVPGGRGGRL